MCCLNKVIEDICIYPLIFRGGRILILLILHFSVNFFFFFDGIPSERFNIHFCAADS